MDQIKSSQQQQAKYPEQQAKTPHEEQVRLQESFKIACAEYYQLGEEFNRFKLQWPSKNEDFSGYEARHVGCHIITNLQAIGRRLEEILQAMKWLFEKFNVHNDETIQLISSEIDKHKKSLAELHKLIKDYQMTMSNHNDAERFKGI